MIFYNGFNLMIDLIIMGVAVYAVKRSWLQGYGAGQTDLQEYWEKEMDMGVIDDDDTTLIRISYLRKDKVSE